MHPVVHAKTQPEHIAITMSATGETVSYRQLNERSNQAAHLFRKHGLKRGDVVAFMLDNSGPEIFELAWGAQRSGLYFTCISTKLNAAEVTYIVEDSNARLLFGSASLADTLSVISANLTDINCYAIGGSIEGFSDYRSTVAELASTPIADESAGIDMLYSSGTTGKPKGVKPALPDTPFDHVSPIDMLPKAVFGLEDGSIYLSPAPLYHAAPLRWCMSVQRLGGNTIIMENFDAENCLRLIEHYTVESVQFVPTHFVRMLKLPQETREHYELSSLKTVLHAAAPCPIAVKEQMLEWFGPIIYEYYSGTENPGFCAISAQDWLSHKGSVGRAIMGTLRICDENGDPVPIGSEGGVYFEGGNPISYHNAPEKIAESTNKHGWGTLGDVGWVDEDGFLYLTDRKSFMIISGGVNIYPQEIENLLVGHPEVLDAAVIGGPDPDFGERVIAVVQPMDMAASGDRLKEDIMAFLRSQLSTIKLPKQIDFRDEIPRHPNGKLYKRLLRDAYWEKAVDSSVKPTN